MVAKLRRINHQRQLKRTDVVGGEPLPPVGWLQLRSDDWEMRRVRAMCQWAAERDRGLSVTEAAEKAAGGVMLGESGKQLTARSLLGWLHDYVQADAMGGSRCRVAGRMQRSSPSSTTSI